MSICEFKQPAKLTVDIHILSKFLILSLSLTKNIFVIVLHYILFAFLESIILALAKPNKVLRINRFPINERKIQAIIDFDLNNSGF